MIITPKFIEHYLPTSAMPAPSAAADDVAALLPWAWAVELLSDCSSAAPLPLLYEWFKKIPDNSGAESFVNARERFALRCLQDALDSGFDGAADVSPRVHFDSNSSAQDALRKLARIKSEGKTTRALKKDLEEFIQQKRAILPAPFLRQTTRIAYLISSARFQSSENKCSNVEHEGACSSFRNGMPGKAVYKDETISTPRPIFSHVLSENMDGNMTTGEDVQCYGSKFAGEINYGNLDACSLEETPVAHNPDIGRVLPSWAQENDQIGRTSQILEEENDIGDRKIVSGSSSLNNDGSGELRSSAAQKLVSERLSASENLASGEGVRCNRHHFGKEINQVSINTCTIGGASVKQPSVIADVLPPSADRDDNVGDTNQNPEVKTDMGQKEILSQATCGNNDEAGEFKSNTARKVIVEKLKFLLDSREKQISSSDTTEHSLCIKCSAGGELLICCNNGCSIGVHAYCLGYLKDLDDSGKFYCSFCSYSRAHAAYVKAKRKASIAKKELSTFLNGVLVKESNFKDVLVDLIKSSLLESNNHVEETRFDQCCRLTTSEQLSKQIGGSLDCHKRTNLVRASDAETVSPIDVDKQNVQVKDTGGTVEINDDNQHSKASAEAVMPLDGEAVVSSPFVNRAERLDSGDKDFKSSDLQSGKDAELITNDIMNDDVDINLVTKGRPQKRKHSDIQPSVQGKLAKLVIEKEGPNRRSPRNLKPTKSYSENPSIHLGRRVQLRWTVEEEEALKDLVAKYSSNGGGMIPWREILEQGNDVFQKTRKPMDLKDKWKNILKLKDREDKHGRKTA